ncbi:MAG: hypothetical protein CMI54_03605 [Parcubacteria group bacterium]|nr:hypothetical protein [Parcubacteria group bacterium]|tara:strand:- start:6620 stop:7405 length:786 start_codon:yes stop_codon:yes gene_type:complete
MKKTKNKAIKIAYAGDRDVSVWILKFLIKQGIKPLALLVSDKKIATHDKELISLCSFLDSSHVLRGGEFKTAAKARLFKKLKLDYIVSIHFPYIYPQEILEIPKQGIINLHPAFLPYNRGWHTASWAIEEGTPYGATLHFMDARLDVGDIIYQEKIKILPDDTADTLYKRVKKLEFAVFKKAWPSLADVTYTRQPQFKKIRTSLHKRKDIKSIQLVDLDKKTTPRELIRRFRALTTNNIKEAAYFKSGSKRYRVQLHIVKE